jgi:gas vesicle protein
MRKIQEIAEKARNDLQEWMDKTKNHVKISLDQLTEQIQSSEKLNNYTPGKHKLECVFCRYCYRTNVCFKK